jgi:uncharacterized protein YaaN involved in tellurite resistance
MVEPATRNGSPGAAPDPTELELTPPQPVAATAPESASGRVKLKPEDLSELNTQVHELVNAVAQLDEHDPKLKDYIDRIHSMGSHDVEQSAALANRLLDRPVKTMRNGLFDAASPISRALIDLRATVEKLDPGSHQDLLSPRRLLGLIPFGNRLNAYFDQYRSSQSHLNAIVEALRRGKDELLRDNAAIDQEKANLWGLMERMEKYIYLGNQLDAALEAKAHALEATDARKAQLLREELLFYTRQKVTDLLTQTAVNIQGYLALELVRRNNLELVKGVDRATTTTLAALRTAVTVAQALTNQKLVLEQISALNTTTGQVIQATSEMLKNQSAQIHAQAASSTVEVQKLQQAFANVYQTMDAIADFRTRSLESMQRTVDSLSSEVAKARTYLDRVRARESPGGTEQVPP